MGSPLSGINKIWGLGLATYEAEGFHFLTDEGQRSMELCLGIYIGDCQNYGPFLGPYYNTGPNKIGGPKKGP